ncbi:hypothetical protein [Cyanobacterium sp. uoEpiScrs1]|uniref:hypothetical protein n=1 Tax=Cyanobacterium sp. uoEpiScrs1 TaxID=2976343 RepID=UPI002269F406|nr:hypothetical protein [Cyanobacterium sp. uoEpiScrs1]
MCVVSPLSVQLKEGDPATGEIFANLTTIILGILSSDGSFGVNFSVSISQTESNLS